MPLELQTEVDGQEHDDLQPFGRQLPVDEQEEYVFESDCVLPVNGQAAN